jgi:hypothetical protein
MTCFRGSSTDILPGVAYDGQDFYCGTNGYRVRARNARSRVTPNNQNSTHTSTRYTLITIAPINNALAAIKALKLEEKLV